MTERDRVWLRWGGRQRIFEAEQLAAIGGAGEFGAGPGTNGTGRRPSVARVMRRLAQLRVAGLVEPIRVFAGPWGWRATAKGLRAAGLALEPPRVDYRQYEHDVDCGWLAIELKGEFGDHLWTEREVRAHDHGRAAPTFCPAEIGPGRTRLLRIPDLAVEGWGDEGEALVVELERFQKSWARALRIVTLYAECPHVAAVRFYCTAEAQRGIERAIRSLAYGAERFEIRAWRGRKEIPR